MYNNKKINVIIVMWFFICDLTTWIFPYAAKPSDLSMCLYIVLVSLLLDRNNIYITKERAHFWMYDIINILLKTVYRD